MESSNRSGSNELAGMLFRGVLSMVGDRVSRRLNRQPETKKKYKCHGCDREFESTTDKTECQHCRSEFIEQVEEEEKKEAPQGDRSSQNSQGSSSPQISLTDLMRYAQLAGTVISSGRQIFNTVERDYGPQIRGIVSVLNLLNTQDVSRQFTNENGRTETVHTNLGTLIAPLIATFGLLNSNSSRSPVSERDIESLEEVQVKEEDYEYNEESKQHEPPKCSICIYEILGPAIKTECRHFFHKDCLKGWLRIHNQCPVCREQVIR